MAGVGRLLAFALMIALVSAGLAVVLQTSELVFYGIKIVGAAYLFYLAYQLWRAEPRAEAESKNAPLGLWALASRNSSSPQATLTMGNPNSADWLNPQPETAH
jgi:threonine/homoserine/homoserine lactone efflux protein